MKGRWPRHVKELAGLAGPCAHAHLARREHQDHPPSQPTCRYLLHTHLRRTQCGTCGLPPLACPPPAHHSRRQGQRSAHQWVKQQRLVRWYWSESKQHAFHLHATYRASKKAFGSAFACSDQTHAACTAVHQFRTHHQNKILDILPSLSGELLVGASSRSPCPNPP